MLNQALWHRGSSKGLIHHSDRGCQYPSEGFGRLAKENGVMESFFHTLKTEHVYQHKFCTRNEAKRSIFEYIEVFYNRKKAHSFLGYLSPEESERK
jgi:putative transposase